MRCRDSVRMLTTAGITVFAMSRNVVAVSGPVSGALFIGGAATVCADDSGDRPSRDAMTSAAAADVIAIEQCVEPGVSSVGHQSLQTLTRLLSTSLWRPTSTPESRLRFCRGPVTIASRSPRNTLISVRTPKVSK